MNFDFEGMTNLGFLNSCIEAITHWRYVQARLPLLVSLLEELLHDSVAPLAVQLQGLGGVAQVSTVDHVLQHLGKIF